MVKILKLLTFFLLLSSSHLFGQMTLSLPATANSCNNPFSLAVTVFSGIAPYSYLWSNNATTQVINVTQSGTYSVVVTDGSGATASASCNVTLTPTYSISPLASTQCQGVPMTLTMSSGGTAPYTIDWGDGNTSNTIANTATHSYMWATNYPLYVTDANGCQMSTTVNVQPTCGNVDLGPDQFWCITGAPMPIFAMGNFAAGSTYEWFDNNGTNLNNPSNVYVPPFMAGNFCVVVTEPNGTVHSDCIMIYPVAPPTVQITPSANCLLPNGTVDLCANVSGSNFTTQWSNGAQSNCITVGTAGIYICNVNDPMAANCGSSDTITVVNCPPTISVVTGMAYFDGNSNSIFDAGDAPLPYHAISLTPSSTAVFTNAIGEYQLAVDTLVNYTVSTGNVGGNISPATASYPIFFPNSGMQSTGNDFIYPPIHDLRCYLTPYSNVVPGFPMYYNLMYNNWGQFSVNNASVSLTYDPNLQFFYSTPAPTSVSGNTLTWNIGTLAAGGSGVIDLHFYTPSTLPLGTAILGSAQIIPTLNDINISNNSSFDTKIAQGSWDPNAKSVSHSEMNLATALSGKKLDYIVQFQNTGTAPAQKVVVMDTLDTKLDILSFEMLVASHAFSLELLDNHILKWTFDNIQLADSFSNEPASHGFVRYQLATKNTVQVGDMIHNRAAIYFDFNVPIFTGDATTLITSKTAIEGETNIGKVSIAPNPVQDKCVISFLGKENEIKEAQIQLYNLNGKLLYTEKVSASGNHFQTEIATKSLPSGVYFIQIVTEKGTLNQKMIKE